MRSFSQLSTVKDRAEEILAIENLNSVNAVELIDSMTKAKALCACKVVAVRKRLLERS